MKIVVAIDSFKGCMSSRDVCAAVAEGIRAAVPAADVVAVPVADGGEGTSEALAEAYGAQCVECDTLTSFHTPAVAPYYISGFSIEGRKAAIVDVAAACGLDCGSPLDYSIMERTSRGVGIMIADAYRRGCRHFFIGLGGSATCDAGIGLLSALGYKFRDAEGNELPPLPSSLAMIKSVDGSGLNIDTDDCRFTAIADVTSPLCGPKGAACMFARQKGATPMQVLSLELNMRRFSAVAAKKFGHDLSEEPGAGAAGGIGFALMAFVNAEMRSGSDAVLDTIGFDNIIKDAGLVITGEGRMDSQTLLGKLPQGVLLRARASGVPTVALTGQAEDIPRLLQAGFAGVFPIVPRPMSLEEAVDPDETRRNLISAGASVARLAESMASRPK